MEEGPTFSSARSNLDFSAQFTQLMGVSFNKISGRRARALLSCGAFFPCGASDVELVFYYALEAESVALVH